MAPGQGDQGGIVTQVSLGWVAVVVGVAGQHDVLELLLNVVKGVHLHLEAA